MLPFVAVIPSGRRDGMMEKCITEMAEGDKDALDRLYEETHVAAYGFALSILKNAQDAEDAVHDAYIQIWKASAGYVPAGKPKAWIFTIIRNQARMHLREQSRAAEALSSAGNRICSPGRRPWTGMTTWFWRPLWKTFRTRSGRS